MRSERLSLRIDADLRDALERRASIEGTNVTAEIVKAARAHLGYAGERDERLDDHENRIARLEQIAGNEI